MKPLQILSRANSSTEEPLASNILIEVCYATAQQYLAWYELAKKLRSEQSQLRALEFFPDCCEVFFEIPPLLEKYEEALFDMGYLVLPTWFDVERCGDDESVEGWDEDDSAEWAECNRLSLDYTTLHVEVAHLDTPSTWGFRWEAGIKHCVGAVESATIPPDVLQAYVDACNKDEKESKEAMEAWVAEGNPQRPMTLDEWSRYTQRLIQECFADEDFLREVVERYAHEDTHEHYLDMFGEEDDGEVELKGRKTT